MEDLILNVSLLAQRRQRAKKIEPSIRSRRIPLARSAGEYTTAAENRMRTDASTAVKLLGDLAGSDPVSNGRIEATIAN
jgi:hypothetical protein